MWEVAVYPARSCQDGNEYQKHFITCPAVKHFLQHKSCKLTGAEPAGILTLQYKKIKR